MATIGESIGAPQELASGLQLGTTTISANQTLTFTLYKRLILPIDGFVFWVNSANLAESKSAAYNSAAYNTANMNSGNANQTANLYTFDALGSLHYRQDIHQNEDSTYAMQAAVFTSTVQVTQFSLIAPDELYITKLPNGSMVAFSSQTGRYTQAGLWHYTGNALYSTQMTQVVESPADINTNLEIVSNSLPIWLQLSIPSLPVYPSYLSLLNTVPPYVTVDIKRTEPLGQSVVLDPFTSQSQLVMDDIQLTFYGLNNNAVLDFQLQVLNNSLVYQAPYGIMNIPVPFDEKKTQTEFQIIAQKKTMALQVNYYQSRTRDIARQLILQAGISYNGELPVLEPATPV